MWLHFLLIALLGFGALVSNTRKNDAGKSFILGLVFIVFLLLAGLRIDTVGNDTTNYAEYFAKIIDCDDLSQVFATSRYEIGFSAVTFFITRLTDNFNLFLLMATAFYLFSVCRFVKAYALSYSSVILLSFGLSMLYDPLVTLRQCMAVGVFLFAIKPFVEREPLHYFSLILLACTFHLSAVILFPAYFLPKLRFTAASDYLRLLLMLALCAATVGVVLRLFVGIFPYYAHYFETVYGGGGVRLASILLLCVRLALFVLALLSNWHLYQGSVEKSDEKSDVILRFNSLMAADLVVAASSLSFNLLDRIEAYFVLPFIVVISNAINYRKNINGRICNLLAILISFVYITVLLVFRSEWFGIFPYSMVF